MFDEKTKAPKQQSYTRETVIALSSSQKVHNTASLETQLQTALSFHKQGCLEKAEGIYKQILLSEPRHFEALQILARR